MQIKSLKILVIKNRAIGDTILLTGSLRILRKYFPSHEIHVLVRSPAGQLLEGLPYVDRVISVLEPKSRFERFAHWVRLISRLRMTRYEMILNFHASFRTALTAKFLRANKVVANHHELKGPNWFSDVVVPNRGQVKAVIDRDLDVLRALGIEASLTDAMPEMRLLPAEISEGESFFKDVPRSSGPRVFLGIGASRSTKRWPAKYMIQLAEKLVGELSAQIVLVTTNEDPSWMRSFEEESAKSPILQKTHALIWFRDKILRDAAKILSQCDLYVGNDSGLKHLAIALGKPTYTFFGPEAPLEWHPYEIERHPYGFVENLGCRTESGKHWCSIEVCEKHEHQCMKRLTVDAAFATIRRLVGPLNVG